MKTKITRFVGMLLFAVMLLTAVPMVAQAEDYPAIALDEEKLVTLDGSSVTEAIFSFTPAETDIYMFRSYETACDTVGYIMDTEQNVIDENDDYLGDRNFHAAASLTAGTTYLLKARFYNTAESESMKVKVEKAVKATSVTIESENGFTHVIGTHPDFIIKVEPEGAYMGALEWAVGDASVIGNFSPNSRGIELFLTAVGTSTLSVTPTYGTGDTVTVTVEDAKTIALDTLAKADVTIYESACFKFTPEEDNTYLFISEGNSGSYASVVVFDENMNLISSQDIYTYTDIRCEFAAEGGKSYIISCMHSNGGGVLDVYVVKPVSATAIRLDRDSYTNYVGTQFSLNAYFEPRGAKSEDIVWSSSDETVASVDAYGVVSLLKVGAATITATSASGLTKSCSVTVADYDNISRCEIVSITLEPAGYAIYRFVPDTDGTYAFMSLSETYDTYGYILDADYNELVRNDDDPEGGRNFKVQCNMTAGTTYMLKASFFNDTTKGTFDAIVAMLDDDGTPIHNISSWTDYDHQYHQGVCSIGNETIMELHLRDVNGVCKCGNSHVHSGTKWYFDTEAHWGTCDECGPDIVENHFYNAEGECLVCDYFAHDCVVSRWDYDDYSHWGYCDLCNVFIDSVHLFDDEGDCECGYFDHTHGEGELAYNAIEHYLACPYCNLQIEDGIRHSYGEDGTCTCGRTIFNGVYIGATEIIEGKYINLRGDVVTQKPNTGYAYFKDGTLTLHNFVYVGAEANPFKEHSGIYAETPLTILLEGTNIIHCEDGDGIYVANGALVIEGEGSIEVIAEGSFDGIDADGGGLTVNSGIIKIDATDHGIETVGDLEINGGVFVIEADDDGIDIDGDVIINDGLFNIHAEDNGIDCYRDMIINGGDFYIVTNDDNGIDLDDGSLEINGGYFELITGDEGISCYDVAAITGGTFVFDAGVGDGAIEIGGGVFIDSSYGEYSVIEVDTDLYHVADSDGNVLRNFILNPAALDGVQQLQEAWVSFLPGDELYHMGEIALSDIVTVTDGDGTVLTEGEDYTVSLIPEQYTEDGVYAVVVEGKDDYIGCVFKLYTVKKVAYGDVNGDSKVNSLDAAQVLKHDAMMITLAEGALTAADVNGDGKVNSLDAAQILKYDALIIDKFPAEKN